MERVIAAWKKHWPEYLMEAWGLGTFMVSAIVFTILFEHPDLPLKEAIPFGWVRRVLIGIAMGLTAVGIMYSPWGKRSGAHLNPAVTLAFFRLGKISLEDAFFYILFQFIGGIASVGVFKVFAFPYLSHPGVNYAVTLPGELGAIGAFVLELLLAFSLLSVVLFTSNNVRIMRFTPIFAGIMLAVFISLEAPYSGMSINPARTVASGLPAGIWNGWWIYFLSPILGMWLASGLFLTRKKIEPGKVPCPGHPDQICKAKNCVYMCNCDHGEAKENFTLIKKVA